MPFPTDTSLGYASTARRPESPRVITPPEDTLRRRHCARNKDPCAISVNVRRHRSLHRRTPCHRARNKDRGLQTALHPCTISVGRRRRLRSPSGAYALGHIGAAATPPPPFRSHAAITITPLACLCRHHPLSQLGCGARVPWPPWHPWPTRGDPRPRPWLPARETGSPRPTPLAPRGPASESPGPPPSNSVRVGSDVDLMNVQGISESKTYILLYMFTGYSIQLFVQQQIFFLLAQIPVVVFASFEDHQPYHNCSHPTG